MNRYIVSDIHGCLNTWRGLLAQIVAQDSNPEFIFVGDYVDRGLFSREVVEDLIALRDKYKCTFLRGNHDDLLCRMIGLMNYTDWSYYAGSDSDNAIQSWAAAHGLVQTYASYDPNGDYHGNNLYGVMKYMPEHVDFFDNLEIMYISDDFFAAHASFPMMSLPRAPKFVRSEMYQSIMWARITEYQIFDKELNDRFLSTWGIPGVFGHTPTIKYGREGEYDCRIIHSPAMNLIDTGSFLRECKGGISALCWETQEHLFEQTHSVDIGYTKPS